MRPPWRSQAGDDRSEASSARRCSQARLSSSVKPEMSGYHQGMRPSGPFPLPVRSRRFACASRPRDSSRSLQVESHEHLPGLERVADGLRRARPQDRRVRSPSGHARTGPRPLLHALQLRDEIGQLEYKVWYFASLCYDQDQRDNEINARRQQVQILFAKAAQASAWFDPELLQIPLTTRAARGWPSTPALAVYRFALEDLYRQQEHVLDEKGEHLLSLSSRFSSAPNDAYAALSTADVKHPAVKLPSGAEVTLTYGQYRAILATNRNQADRAAAFREFHRIFEANVNTYAVAVQRRAAARLVSFAGARLQDDARRGAARQQHPDGGGREPDRADEGRHRAAAALSPAAEEGARPRDLPLLRRDDSAGRLRSQVSVRGCAGMAAGVGGAARRRLPAADARASWTASASTSTRTRASGAARIRRRCTAASPTCC